MARFIATWTNTEALDWEIGDFVRYLQFRRQIGQDIEFLGQKHKHDGAPGSGKLLDAGDPKSIWFRGAP
jgi:hypothetical protein